MQLPNQRTRWHSKRIARLAFLVGAGRAPEAIADDPLIRTTPNAVRLKARALDIDFRESQTEVVSPTVLAVFEGEAKRYDMQGRQLLDLLLRACVEEPNYIHSMIDG